MRIMQIELVLQTNNQSELAKKSVFCSPGLGYNLYSNPDRLNHCGRLLGKTNGHKSTYIKVCRCTFFYLLLCFFN